MVSFSVPPIDPAEVLRRAALGLPSPGERALLAEGIRAMEGLLDYSVTETPLPLSVLEEEPYLKEQLGGADVLLRFTLSLGEAPERLLDGLEEDDPDQGILYRAIFAERLDALCEAFLDSKEKLLSDGGFLTPNFAYVGRDGAFAPTPGQMTRLVGLCATPQEHTAARCRTCFLACSHRKA